MQSFSNFHERIHGRRFFPTLDSADENRRKTGPLGQFFLAEIGFPSSDTNRFPQQTTMLLAGVHVQLKKQALKDPTMSLTTNFRLCEISISDN